MPRQYVLTKVPAASYDAVNNYMIALFGDDPGSEEIPVPNAYIDGQDPTTPTHSFGVANVSQADCNSIVSLCDVTNGCDANDAGSTSISASGYHGPYDFWALAFSLWGLRQVQAVTP